MQYLLEGASDFDLGLYAIRSWALGLRPQCYLSYVHISEQNGWIYVFHPHPYSPCTVVLRLFKGLEAIMSNLYEHALGWFYTLGT